MHLYWNGRFLTQAVTGVQRYAGELLRAMDAVSPSYPDVTVEVLVPHAPLLQDLGLQHIRMRAVGYGRGSLWEQFELPFWCRGGLLFCPCNSAPIASLLSGQAVAVTVHDLSFRYFPEAYTPAFRAWYTVLMGLVFRRAQTILTVSSSERERLVEHYPGAARKTHAVLSGVRRPDAAPPTEGPVPAPFALFVGSLNKRKNLPRLIEAMAIVHRNHGLGLVVVGSRGGQFAGPNLEAFDNLPWLSWAGSVSEATLIEYYRRARVFVFVSLYEAFGLPALEAMAQGCPVVASNRSSLPEVCGAAAEYCDPDRVEDIAAAIERVLTDDSLRSRLRGAGFRRVAELTWDSSARETLSRLCPTESAGT